MSPKYHAAHVTLHTLYHKRISLSQMACVPAQINMMGRVKHPNFSKFEEESITISSYEITAFETPELSHILGLHRPRYSLQAMVSVTPCRHNPCAWHEFLFGGRPMCCERCGAACGQMCHGLPSCTYECWSSHNYLLELRIHIMDICARDKTDGKHCPQGKLQPHGK